MSEFGDGAMQKGAYVFFFASTVLQICCVIVFEFVLRASPVTHHFAAVSTPVIQREFSPQKPKFRRAPPELDLEKQELMDSLTDEDEKDIGVDSFDVFRRIKWHCFNIFMVFVVTLSLFPGITSGLQSTNQALNGPGWFPLILTTLFNFGDLIGRYFPQFHLGSQTETFILSGLRLVFLPVFFMQYQSFPPHSDIFIYAIMFLFSLSNGYLASMSMIFATGDLVQDSERDTAGTIMVFFLALGLTSGVYVGLGMKEIADIL
eukprot:436963_1